MWGSGGQHTIATTSPQSPMRGLRFLWDNWSDGQPISHTVCPTTNTTYTATFRRQYFLTMAAGSGGAVIPRSAWENAGTNITIRAIAHAPYHFVNWTGMGTWSYSGPNNPATITMNGPITETANFSR